ncbi:chemotaxis protein CheW [Duganella sp. FT3S]|uniref:Chemotaxis protein CheW n=1 Tax=Rugamonas fusca TaxID=2758568 RepID=A0A7W2I7E5_9BURK|nr:chemotaxis protein CheW [Rugamonas fusca]MBA5606426.1 chemotaxis protein CheW [Rugamonas fusca]
MNTAVAASTAQAMQSSAAGAGEYLSFRNGAEEYGIDILKVQEIRGYEVPTRIANAPAHVLGVHNLRGLIVPVLDMRIRLGMADVAYDGHTVTIVLNIGDRVVGMVVDGVSDVVELRHDQIRPVPECGVAAATLHVNGIATIDLPERQRMLILLDIEQLVASGAVLPAHAADAHTPVA